MPQDDRSIDSAVQPCACVKHTFGVVLAAAPDASPRPDWWPVDGGDAYGGEQMDIALAGVDAQQKLDGGAAFNVERILPPGAAQVQFTNFFEEVLADVERRGLELDF